MPLVKNLFIHALAGSGKTTLLVSFALKFPDKKILITTFTNKNVSEIKNKIIDKNGFIPNNIIILPWFSFLLSECCRPYQRCLGLLNRLTQIVLMPNNSVPYISENNVISHYLLHKDTFYSDKLAKFATRCNEKTQGLVIKRLEETYDYIFVDEAQDLAGYDFEILDNLLKSNCKLILVGDKRQKTFQTSPTTKNKKYNKDILLWFMDKAKEKKGTLMYLKKCWRCNEFICTFSSKLYPELPASIPIRKVNYNHSGLFYIKKCNLGKYMKAFSPIILTNDKRSRIEGYDYLNYGNSKGTTLDRILIIPTKPIKDYLKTGDLAKCQSGKEKFYIALTRARHSIAFLIDDSENLSKYKFSFQEWS